MVMTTVRRESKSKVSMNPKVGEYYTNKLRDLIVICTGCIPESGLFSGTIIAYNSYKSKIYRNGMHLDDWLIDNFTHCTDSVITIDTRG